MAHAPVILDNYGYRHTLEIRNTYSFSTTTMVTRTRHSVTYNACITFLGFVYEVRKDSLMCSQHFLYSGSTNDRHMLPKFNSKLKLSQQLKFSSELIFFMHCNQLIRYNNFFTRFIKAEQMLTAGFCNLSPITERNALRTARVKQVRVQRLHTARVNRILNLHVCSTVAHNGHERHVKKMFLWMPCIILYSCINDHHLANCSPLPHASYTAPGTMNHKFETNVVIDGKNAAVNNRLIFICVSGNVH